MRKIIVLSLCLFAFSCAHAPRAENYPYSEIEGIYDTVLETMMPDFLKSIEADGKHYADDLKLFIDKTMPKSKFVSIMTSKEDTKRIFERAKTDIDYRKTKEFMDRFTVVVAVSTQMAQSIFGGRFDVFASKYVYPTEMSKKLFLMTDDSDYEQLICWVYGEVSQEEAKKELGNTIEILPGDTFYGFSSPEWYWQHMMGRQGYLQVRENKIIAIHGTLMN